MATLELNEPLKIAVAKPGYASAALVVTAGNEYDVALQRAHDLVVRAHTLYNKPIAGISIALSMGGSAAFDRDGAPGLDPATAVHVGRTGPDGALVLSGLQAGIYRLHPPFSDTWIPVQGNVFPELRVTVPGAEADLTFVELHAAVVTFLDDECVGFRETGFRRLGSPGGPGGIGWQAARDKLSAQYPGSHVVVFAPRVDTPEPPEIRGVPFTKWRGELAEMRLVLEPLSGVKPKIVDLGTTPRRPSEQSSRVRFIVTDLDGQAVDPGDGFRLHVSDGPTPSDRTRAVLERGVWREVPPGKSHFVPVSNTYVTGLATRETVLRPGETHEVVVQFTEPMRPVTFQVVIDGQPEAASCVLIGARGTAGRVGHASIAVGAPPLWMMAGKWTGTFHCDGCQPLTTEWEASLRDPGATVTLAFRSLAR